MLTHLKHQLAVLLTDAARKGITKLDKNSPIARELRALDVDAVLKEDIHKICAVISLGEMVRLLTLVAQLKSGIGDLERVKKDVKKIAKDLVERIEKKKGGLSLPVSCRDLLFDL